MDSKNFTRSFAGGELAPQLFGRLDLTKFQTGLQKCLNWIVTPQGPIENRPGFEYVLKTKTASAVLLPFTYNSDQSFALELGEAYLRFHTQGGTLLETAQSVVNVTPASPGLYGVIAHGFSVGDWVYLATMGGMPALTGRWGIVASVPDADHFTLTDLFGANINTSTMPAYTGGGTAARVYEIATLYTVGHLLDLHYVQSADVLTLVHPSYQPYELRRLGATNWTLTPVTFGPGISCGVSPAVVTNGPGGGTPIAHFYVCTAVAKGTLEESLASPSAGQNWDLTVAGNYIDVTPPVVSTAVRFNIYKLQSGLYGYIGQTDGTAFRDSNITPDMSKTPPLANAPFSTQNPRAVSYFEQRRIFAGGSVDPQTLWTTRSGTESNLTYSIPTQDDDAITARIVAREANTIQHLVPLNDLLALTSGGVWRISPSDGGALTPASFSVKPQSYVGASAVQPVVTSSSVLYAPARGGHLREVAYKWEAQSYQADDLSVLAPHLFDYKTLRQLTYSKSPYQVLWAVRSDGVLLGLTHQPEHEVKAWHQHDSQGLFKSVCAIPEGDEDGVYVIVERTVDGQAVEYIERMHSRQFDELADAFFVDAGATYDGAPTSMVTGLWHLEGRGVVALADGGVEPAQTVVDGTITLSADASKVHVGLAYNCDAQTMPLSLQAAAFGQGAEKNINQVGLRTFQSSGLQAGPSFTRLREYPQRSIDDSYGAPPGMVTGVAQLKLDPSWQRDGTVCVRQGNPLPITLLAMTVETASGG